MVSWLSRYRQSIVQVVGTLLAIVLLVLLIREGGWQGMLAAMQKIKLVNLLWVALLFIVSRVAATCRWHVLLRSGGVNIRFKDSMALTFTGLFASNFLPTTIGGDVVRLGGAIQMGFDRAICLASIAADRLIGMLGMLMALPIGVFYSWNILQNAPIDLSWVGVLQRPFAFIKRTFSAFSIWLQKPGSLLLSLLFTWIHMLCMFGSIYIFTSDLGSDVSFWMIAGLWSLTYFITLVPISINGYGLQELSFTFLFSHVAGVSPTMSLTIVVLIRAYLVISSLPGAFLLPSALAAMTDRQAASSQKTLS
jgi:glycosyltransferase 2 family protein